MKTRRNIAITLFCIFCILAFTGSAQTLKSVMALDSGAVSKPSNFWSANLPWITNLDATGITRGTLPDAVQSRNVRMANSMVDGIAESYASRARTRSSVAKAAVSDFVGGLNNAGLLADLVDFSFFSAGMQPDSGAPISWRNTGVMQGKIERLPGGFNMNNYFHGSTNWLYFTNLPPTPNGRTLVVWYSQSFIGNQTNQLNSCIWELAVGAGVNASETRLFFDGVNLEVYTYDGSGQNFLNQYSGSMTNWNALVCQAAMLTPTTAAAVHMADQNAAFSGGLSNYQTGTWSCTASPAVLRLGTERFFNQNQTCYWNGLIRGWCYFSRALTAAEVRAVDNLVPRIGVIVDGDSKSSVYFDWPNPFMQCPPLWGLAAIRTNMAVSGTLLSAMNNPAGNTMEARFPTAISYATNSRYPVQLYAVRGGQNDLGGGALSYVNLWNSMTNLYAWARTNGWKPVAFTLDRTSTSWPNNNNSNGLWIVNRSLRSTPSAYSYLADVEEMYRQQWGETPYVNGAVYGDGVHETYSTQQFLGTNVLRTANPTFGWELDSMFGAADLSGSFSGVFNGDLNIANQSVYSAGTVYTLTATPAAVTFGTTSPTVTLPSSGNWLITGNATLKYNAATYAANQTAALKWRRTSGSAADLANGSRTSTLRILTTTTDTAGTISLPPVVYTATAGDVIAMFGSVSATPSAGSVTVENAEIVAVRIQ